MTEEARAWIRLTNIAYGIVALIMLAAIVAANVWDGFLLSDSHFSRSPAIGLAAFIGLLYGLISFGFIVDTKPRIAGVISYSIYYVMAATAVFLTPDPSTILPLLVLAAATSAVHGWAVWALTLLSTSAFFVAVNNQILAREEFDDPILWLAITAGSGLLGMVVIGIHFIRKRPRKDKPSHPGSSGQVASDILINAIADGIATITRNGQINIFNPSAQKISGWSLDEARGLDHHSVLIFTDEKGNIYPNERNPINLAFQNAKPIQDLNAMLQTRSNKKIEVDVLASPIVQAEKVIGVVCIFRDVSKQRNEERQRAEFISTASHEMRTPVAAIEGYLALALNDKVSKIDTAARGYLEKAHASTQHLGKLFQDLLTAAKSEDGRLTNHPEVIEVGQLLEELIEGASFTAEKKGLLLKSDFGSDNDRQVAGAPVVKPVAYVFADAERLREVITNLFDNAVKYTEEGSITIGMHADAKEVVIKVADTGPGIPKEDIPHLFQKFYRVDNSATRQIGGTGLGLFISRKIIELYQGRIWVESEFGEGSTFMIALPRLSAERAQELMRQAAATASPLGNDSTTSVKPEPAAQSVDTQG